MPRDKTETHKRIVPAATAEFLEKGFEQASMRSIAARINMSVAGLYRHFADKEALFSALVTPALDAFEAWYKMHKAMDYKLLDRQELDAMWESEAEAAMIREVIYPHFVSFKLLVCCSEGTRFADFQHHIVMLEQKETIAFLEAARARNLPVKDISPEELHLLLSAYVSALFEVVVHDFSLEEAEHYLKTFAEFFVPGWRAVLGL